MNQSLAALKEILECKNLAINKLMAEKWSPLLVAVNGQNEAIIDVLLASQYADEIDFDIRNQEGYNAMELAQYYARSNGKIAQNILQKLEDFQVKQLDISDITEAPITPNKEKDDEAESKTPNSVQSDAAVGGWPVPPIHSPYSPPPAPETSISNKRKGGVVERLQDGVKRARGQRE